MLKSTACGIGSLALAGMQGAHAVTSNPLAAKTSLVPQRAKRVIFIFMAGGPSHVDLLDPKPMLSRYHGTTPPAEVDDDEDRTKYLLGSPFSFPRPAPREKIRKCTDKFVD